jgi:hypothetical protein
MEASRVHHSADGTSAIMIGPVNTYYTLQTGSTAFERLSQPTQLSQSPSLCTTPSSLIPGDAAQDINTSSIPQLALDPQGTIQLHYPHGSASFSWQHTEFIPYEDYQRTSMPESNQVVTTQEIPYGSKGGVTATGPTRAQGITMPITHSKENSDSSLPSDHRAVLHMPTTSTMYRTEHLSIELGAHSLSPAELNQPFLLQGPSDWKQPSSTEYVDVTAGTLVGHGVLPMTFTPKPSIDGQSGAKPFVKTSSIESGLDSFPITSPAANGYLFLQDRVIASKSTAIAVATLAADISVSITTDADSAVQTDSVVQQGQAFATTPQVQGLQRLTKALIQQADFSAATPTHRSYSESRNPSASDQRDRRMSGKAIGAVVGAVAGGACGFLGIFAIVVRQRKRKRHRIWISNQYWNDPNRSYISFGSM